MNLKSKEWKTAYQYQKDDVASFSLPYIIDPGVFPNKTIENNIEIFPLFYNDIKLNKNFEYYAEAWTRKSDEKITSLTDAYLLLNSSRSVDDSLGYDILNNTDLSDLFSEHSTGIGLFIVYKDASDNILDIKDENLEKHYSMYSALQVGTEDWKKMIFKINHNHAPEQAVSFNVYCYSNLSLEIDVIGEIFEENVVVQNPKASFLSESFYCHNDHTSSSNNSPSEDINAEYWTQDFKWRPDFQSKVKFQAKIEALKTEDGNIFKSLSHINGVEAEFMVNFSMLTEKRANAIVHFLQNKSEPDLNFYGQNNLGKRDAHNDFYFNYDFFFPYKTLKTYCVEFQHKIEFDNIHSVSAKFKTRQAITDSVYSFQGYNEDLDGLVTINFDELENGESYNFTIPEGDFDFTVGETYGNCVISSIDVDIGSCPIIEWQKENGNPLEIFLENYRILKLKENLSSEDGDNLSFESDKEFSTTLTENKFEIIIPNPCLKHSIFFKYLEEGVDYPYNKVKDFKFVPSYVFSVDHNPEIKKAGIDRNYDPEYKSGVNANNNFILNLVFEQRSEKEAVEIMLFFERHLGYKSFQVALPDPYSKQGKQRFFYCPRWEHTYVYKDNHTISANFIECVNVEEE